MPIENILIELGDIAAKIDNVRSLLHHEHTSALTSKDRANLEGLLARLNAKKTVLEDKLRLMANRPPKGVSGS